MSTGLYGKVQYLLQNAVGLKYGVAEHGNTEYKHCKMMCKYSDLLRFSTVDKTFDWYRSLVLLWVSLVITHAHTHSQCVRVAGGAVGVLVLLAGLCLLVCPGLSLHLHLPCGVTLGQAGLITPSWVQLAEAENISEALSRRPPLDVRTV